MRLHVEVSLLLACWRFCRHTDCTPHTAGGDQFWSRCLCTLKTSLFFICWWCCRHNTCIPHTTGDEQCTLLPITYSLHRHIPSPAHRHVCVRCRSTYERELLTSFSPPHPTLHSSNKAYNRQRRFGHLVTTRHSLRGALAVVSGSVAYAIMRHRISYMRRSTESTTSIWGHLPTTHHHLLRDVLTASELLS
jgi:hypothetical protein